MKQNRFFTLIVISLLAVFSLVIYFGKTQIYDNEQKWLIENKNASLKLAAGSVKDFFWHSENDLLFLLESSVFTSYVNTDLKPSKHQDELISFFDTFVKAYEHYHQVGILDENGTEMVLVRNDVGSPVFSEPQRQDEGDRSFFREAIKLQKGQICIRYLFPEIDRKPPQLEHPAVIRFATPIVTGEGNKKGILFLDLHLSKLLVHLSVDMFLQNDEGVTISLKTDGNIETKKSDYDFPDSEGEFDISDNRAIHYTAFELLSGRKLVVAAYHDHTPLQEEIQKLNLTSAGLFLFTTVLLFIISYINFSRYKRLVSSYQAIISSMAGLTESRDPDTGQHLNKTREYTVLLARKLRNKKKFHKTITRNYLENIYFAAALHDIGKVGISDSILLKEGKLTPQEFEKMKEHVRIGKRLLEDIITRYKIKEPLFMVGLNICAYHHETYDGKGYLEGLKGEEIPLEARIFALCDAYDAIRSKRPYKPELTHEEAVKRIKSDSGKHFDPDIVDSFLEHAGEFEKISETLSQQY